MELRVREAAETDLMLLFNWCNDSLTRSLSFSQDPISLEIHKEWLNQQLRSQDTCLLIIEGYYLSSWVPIAQVRMASSGEISLSLDKDFRGQSLATPVINIASTFFRSRFNIDILIAHIKKENIASIKSFENAGFQFLRTTHIQGHPCLEYIYNYKSRSI